MNGYPRFGWVDILRFQQISSSMYEPYVLAFIQFHKETLRNSKKGAAIPHLSKELFYGLIIGIPPLQEQRRVVQKIEQSSKLLK